MIGAVLIGRNEGERLVRCLASVHSKVDRVVYVDSGSTDGSVAAARAAGAEVVTLDPNLPFTAARARNAGVDALRSGPTPDFVLFMDGDCELQAGWIETSLQFLQQNAAAAAACGRRRERFPEVSVYNRLCDREWNTPVGQTKACGGDSLMRFPALDQVGGFNPDLIAGEEPELCVRLRAAGWQIWRLDHEMVLHDAAMTRFSQWWKRMRRGGHAAAEGMAMHGAAPERLGVASVRRAVFWGLLLPAVMAACVALFGAWGLLIALLYPAQVARLAYRMGGKKTDWEYAFFLTLGKFPEAIGILGFYFTRLRKSPPKIIEYK
jgi:GT2 family glycosyltransferase